MWPRPRSSQTLLHVALLRAECVSQLEDVSVTNRNRESFPDRIDSK